MSLQPARYLASPPSLHRPMHPETVPERWDKPRPVGTVRQGSVANRQRGLQGSRATQTNVELCIRSSR